MQYKSSKYKYIPSRLYEPKKKTGIENTDNNFMNLNNTIINTNNTINNKRK